ncbi:hypothetical protein [Tepidimonas sp.]|uniref:hypothetical protein n=1 Tax=Tepidimonas sp. TaxID=2002775 RepID=UPI003918EB2C
MSEPSPDFKGIKTRGWRCSSQPGCGPNQALISKGLRLHHAAVRALVLLSEPSPDFKGIKTVGQCTYSPFR